jgi:predicted nucleic-acid-binding Zn-ribbon protein
MAKVSHREMICRFCGHRWNESRETLVRNHRWHYKDVPAVSVIIKSASYPNILLLHCPASFCESTEIESRLAEQLRNTDSPPTPQPVYHAEEQLRGAVMVENNHPEMICRSCGFQWKESRKAVPIPHSIIIKSTTPTHNTLSSCPACKSTEIEADAPWRATEEAQVGEVQPEEVQQEIANVQAPRGNEPRKKRPYVCEKCGGTWYTTGETRTTGSGLTRFLNIQNQKYATVTCTDCGHTDIYRIGGKGIGNIIDFLTN